MNEANLQDYFRERNLIVMGYQKELCLTPGISKNKTDQKKERHSPKKNRLA